MYIALMIFFAALSLISLGLLTSYRHVPLAELKRRAREGDTESKSLYAVAAYGYSLGTLLWFVAGVTGGLFFWSLVGHAPSWLAIMLGALYIWTVLVWLPTRWPARMSRKFAVLIAPALASLLGHLHVILDKPQQFMAQRWPSESHTGMYDVEDFLELLDGQRMQPDSRLDPAEIETAMHALTFSRRLVREVMTPAKDVKSISADESLGPVLMAELHDSGFTAFPVYESKKTHIVGTLFLSDLADKKVEGKVKDAMHPAVYHLKDEQSLASVLPEIFQPHRHFFIVTNNFDDFVGVITAADILSQVVGYHAAHNVELPAEPEEEKSGLGGDQELAPEPAPIDEEPPEVVE